MKSIFAIVALAGSAAVANAEVITSWVNFGQPGTQASTPVGTQAANVTGVAMTRGAGLSGNAGSNSLNSAGWNTLDSTDYVSFGFTVASGYSVDLSTLWMGTRSSASGPGSLGVFYSVDGFAAPVFTFSQSGTAFTNSIANLSSLANITGSVEFRIYALSQLRADGASGISSSGTFRVGDHFDGSTFTEFRFEGDVVPAPATVALAGIGGLIAARRRRA